MGILICWILLGVLALIIIHIKMWKDHVYYSFLLEIAFGFFVILLGPFLLLSIIYEWVCNRE